jgi:hypothetical protein
MLMLSKATDSRGRNNSARLEVVELLLLLLDLFAEGVDLFLAIDHILNEST